MYKVIVYIDNIKTFYELEYNTISKAHNIMNAVVINGYRYVVPEGKCVVKKTIFYPPHRIFQVELLNKN